MKNFMKITVMAAFIAAMFTSTLSAQDMDRKGIRDKFKENLTEEQIKLLEDNKEAMEALRDAFKATLTEEQQAILENAELTGKEKREALKALLSEDQLALLDSNKEARKAQREAFRATLTDEQKANMRKGGGKGKRPRGGMGNGEGIPGGN